MKMRLGSRVIELNRVSKVTKIGQSTAVIRFVTGGSIHVACCVRYPNNGLISYPGHGRRTQGVYWT